MTHVIKDVVREERAAPATTTEAKTSNLSQASQPAEKIIIPEQPVVVTGRKLPTRLSKSMLISLMNDAGWGVKEMVAVSAVMLERKLIIDEFNEGHCRNSVGDFTKHPHKAENARLVAKATHFRMPAKPKVLVAVKADPAPIAQAAQAPTETTKVDKK